MNSGAECILMKLAERCHPKGPQKARGLGGRNLVSPAQASGKSCTDWKNSICTTVQVPVWMDLEEDQLLHALATVNVNDAGDCISQDVAVGLRKGLFSSLGHLSVESTTPGFVPPQYWNWSSGGGLPRW